MGEQYSMCKAIYVSDSLAEYVVQIRVDQAVTGGFPIIDPTTPVSLPRKFKMRYVIGYDTFNNTPHKQYVGNPGDSFFEAGMTFFYLSGTFFIGAQIGEKMRA